MVYNLNGTICIFVVLFDINTIVVMVTKGLFEKLSTTNEHLIT